LEHDTEKTRSGVHLLDDLGERGIDRLMIKGGTSIHTAVLAEGLADELHLAVAPLFVGQADAPRFVNPAEFPGSSRRRMQLVDVTRWRRRRPCRSMEHW